MVEEVTCVLSERLKEGVIRKIHKPCHLIALLALLLAFNSTSLSLSAMEKLSPELEKQAKIAISTVQRNIAAEVWSNQVALSQKDLQQKVVQIQQLDITNKMKINRLPEEQCAWIASRIENIKFAYREGPSWFNSQSDYYDSIGGYIREITEILDQHSISYPKASLTYPYTEALNWALQIKENLPSKEKVKRNKLL